MGDVATIKDLLASVVRALEQANVDQWTIEPPAQGEEAASCKKVADRKITIKPYKGLKGCWWDSYFTWDPNPNPELRKTISVLTESTAGVTLGRPPIGVTQPRQYSLAEVGILLRVLDRLDLGRRDPMIYSRLHEDGHIALDGIARYLNDPATYQLGDVKVHVLGVLSSMRVEGSNDELTRFAIDSLTQRIREMR